MTFPAQSLPTASSTDDLAAAFGVNSGGAPIPQGPNESVLLARIKERELLLRWRHAICCAFSLPLPSDWRGHWTCPGCGRELRLPQEDTFLSLDGRLCRGYSMDNGVEPMSAGMRCGWCPQ